VSKAKPYFTPSLTLHDLGQVLYLSWTEFLYLESGVIVAMTRGHS
jgi:hypothetical protein